MSFFQKVSSMVTAEQRMVSLRHREKKALLAEHRELLQETDAVIVRLHREIEAGVA